VFHAMLRLFVKVLSLFMGREALQIPEEDRDNLPGIKDQFRRSGMAKRYNIDLDAQRTELITVLCKSIQSANLNFLFGSGCASPAIPVLGGIEKEIASLFEENRGADAEQKTAEFLKPFLEATKTLLGTRTGDVQRSLELHVNFVETLADILVERKSNILPKQASIFSTNYDLFFEKAFEELKIQVKVNDGFNRSSILSCDFPFSSSEFFNSLYNNGNLYNYRVQIPSINLIKLHGSLNWKVIRDRIEFAMPKIDDLLAEFEGLSKSGTHLDFNKKFSVVLPRNGKFQDSVLIQVYYDLLRIYANQMDKENVLLIVEGFSFEDRHILDVTIRALKNPTLKILVFCYDHAKLAGFEEKFQGFNNVDMAYSENGKVDFEKFTALLRQIIPVNRGAAAMEDSAHE
jgi:hypothetical protein